jgi:hypothetical protein
MGINTSLFKQNVNVTQTYKGNTHKGIDLSTGKVEQPVYLPKKAVEGYVHKILAGYTYNGKYYRDSPIIYIKHKDGSGSRYIHSYPRNVKVKVGDTIKAGTQVCATGNSGYSFGDHLHFEWLKKWDDLTSHTDPIPYITSEDSDMLKIGNKIEFTGVQNMRKGSGTSFPITGSTAIGMLSIIEDGPRVADGYTWYDLNNGDWVADVGKFKIYIPQEPVPTPEPTECEKRLKILEDKITYLTEDLGASEKGEQMALERADFLEGTLAIREKELKDKESENSRILEERNRFEQEKLALQLKIDELKKPHWTERLRDRLWELWDEFKDSIISFIKRK